MILNNYQLDFRLLRFPLVLRYIYRYVRSRTQMRSVVLTQMLHISEHRPGTPHQDLHGRYFYT